ncbi:MAG: hypothetical protein VB027_09870 [Gordonibacter sp.]|nr:hypothetical protein [Gordonibacter sp.]
MSDIDVFTIEDDFDPLADLDLDVEEETPDSDYRVPIPDAELSRVPDQMPLSAEERIAKLIAGMPGQKFRLLCAVEECAQPRTMDEVVTALDAAYPDTLSVYGPAQIVQLLERAGALERIEVEEPESPAAEVEPTETFLSVVPVAPCRYAATQEGLAAVALHRGDDVVANLIGEDVRYRPLYRRILELCAREDGCPTKELDAEIDPDPLCFEPRRFCSYFVNRLEQIGAVEWKAVWTTTDFGRKALASRELIEG